LSVQHPKVSKDRRHARSMDAVVKTRFYMHTRLHRLFLEAFQRESHLCPRALCVWIWTPSSQSFCGQIDIGKVEASSVKHSARLPRPVLRDVFGLKINFGCCTNVRLSLSPLTSCSHAALSAPVAALQHPTLSTRHAPLKNTLHASPAMRAQPHGTLVRLTPALVAFGR